MQPGYLNQTRFLHHFEWTEINKRMWNKSLPIHHMYFLNAGTFLQNLMCELIYGWWMQNIWSAHIFQEYSMYWFREAGHILSGSVREDCDEYVHAWLHVQENTRGLLFTYKFYLQAFVESSPQYFSCFEAVAVSPRGQPSPSVAVALFARGFL